jgi:hypothetical protein
MLGGALAVVAVLAIAPAAALANNADYACSLMPPQSVVKKEFKLPHAVEQIDSEGGTDEEDGAFTSSCVIGAYVAPPKPGVLPFGRGKVRHTRKGFAEIDVHATVQDEGEAGNNWDPADLRTSELEAREVLIEGGGHVAYFPQFGQTGMYGWEWPATADNAGCIWEHGEDGFLVIDVHSHGGAGQHLANLATYIAPKFRP